MTRLTQEMWKSGGSNHGIFDPSEFRRQMGIFSPKFMGFDQHDSQEFFTYTLDGIHTELNRIEKNAPVSKVQWAGRTSQDPVVVMKFEFCAHLARLLRKLDHVLLWILSTNTGL